MGMENDRGNALEVFSLLMYLTSKGKHQVIWLKYIFTKFTHIIHICNGFITILIHSSAESGTTTSNSEET